MADQKPARGRKKTKQRKILPEGIVHVRATFNNTHITVTDLKGNTVSWSKAGASGFRGSRKGTPFAAQVAVDGVVADMKEAEMKRVTVLVCGPGPGREPAIRMIQSNGFVVICIKDVTPLPHNGCRPPKRRRV